MKSPDDFARAVSERQLSRFNLRDCSMCGYPVGYVFGAGRIAIDTGCDCVTYGPVITETEWESLADHYNRQKNPEYIAQMDAYFGFLSEGDRSE